MYCGIGIDRWGPDRRKPPAHQAASATQVRGSSQWPLVPSSSAACLRSSSGSLTHASAASSAAALSSAKWSEDALAHLQAHHAAARRGSREAQNVTASSIWPAATRVRRNSIGNCWLGLALIFC